MADLVGQEARLEVQLTRIADTLALSLKLQAIRAGITLTALRTWEEELLPQPDAQLGAQPDASATELLVQSPEEIERLQEAYERLESRLGRGKVPPDLDLYAEAEKAEPGNLEEEP